MTKRYTPVPLAEAPGAIREALRATLDSHRVVMIDREEARRTSTTPIGQEAVLDHMARSAAQSLYTLAMDAPSERSSSKKELVELVRAYRAAQLRADLASPDVAGFAIVMVERDRLWDELGEAVKP